MTTLYTACGNLMVQEAYGLCCGGLMEFNGLIAQITFLLVVGLSERYVRHCTMVDVEGSFGECIECSDRHHVEANICIVGM